MTRSGSAREEALRRDGPSLLLRIWAHPGADRDSVEGVDPFRGAFVVRVRARAVDGEANAGLVSLVSKRLGCPVVLEAGRTARLKLLRAFTEMSTEEAADLLLRAFQ
jgi:uncharacterized protein (TIGR00251 family)